MKLIIGGNPIALQKDARISIQRSSPALNEDTGSFSYPFPVPTLPNQQILGWPGKLQRAGEIADQTFILEDSGVQVFSGEVDYDLITKNEIGIILKSGYTVFRSKMSGKKLGELDYGSESWLPLYYTSQQVTSKLAEWDAANTSGNGKYYVSPIAINDALSTTSVDDYVNKIDKLTGKLKYDSGGTRQNVNLICCNSGPLLCLKRSLKAQATPFLQTNWEQVSSANLLFFPGSSMSLTVPPASEFQGWSRQISFNIRS